MLFGHSQQNTFMFDEGPPRDPWIGGSFPLCIWNPFPISSASVSLFIDCEWEPTSRAVTLAMFGHTGSAYGVSAGTTPLFVGGQDSGTRSSPINLVITGENPSTYASLPLYVANDYAAAGRMVKLYIAGFGTTPGATPLSAAMNLHLERGPEAGFELFLANNYVEATAPLFIAGRPTANGQTTLFIEGFGGSSDASMNLVIPNVSVPTSIDGQTTLVIPAVSSGEAATLKLYINGWRPL